MTNRVVCPISALAAFVRLAGTGIAARTGLAASALATKVADVGSTDAVSAYLRRVRPLVTRNPLLVGFGIQTHEDASLLSAQTDGFIVGSALIKLCESLWDNATLTRADRLDHVGRFIRALKYGTV